MNYLSNREWEVVKLLLQGKSNKMIAASLGITIRTVEFHLMNIYAKYGVGSRLELVLKLTHAAELTNNPKLWESTVDDAGQTFDNGLANIISLATNWFKQSAAKIRKESNLKASLRSKHVLIGQLTALGTGGTFFALLAYFGHMTPAKYLPWVPALIVVLAGIGTAIGVIAHRRGSHLLKVFFGAFLGTGFGAILMMPLTAFVIVPIAKLLSLTGLINRAALSVDASFGMATAAMIVMWLAAGIGLGALWLLTGKRQPVPPPLPSH